MRGRAIVRGGHGTAARVADLLSGIMTWAVDEQLIVHNPVHRVRRFRGPPRDRYLSNTELAVLGALLREEKCRVHHSIHPFTMAIVELLCLTGCRLGEITNLRWSEVDFQESCFRLANTKTGRSMRAVGSGVLVLIRSWPAHVGSEFVFPALRGLGAYQGAKHAIKHIFDYCKIGSASSHTLRHTFASVASRLGYTDATIAGLLGHAGRGVTSRYIHRPDAALLSAANAVSIEISTLLASNDVCPAVEDTVLRSMLR